VPASALIREAIQAHHPIGLLGEVRGLLELPRLLLHSPELTRQPRGRGQRVLALPDYGAGDVSTVVLRAYLSHSDRMRIQLALSRTHNNSLEYIHYLVYTLEVTTCPLPWSSTSSRQIAIAV
jgi:hypothetical protein